MSNCTRSARTHAIWFAGIVVLLAGVVFLPAMPGLTQEPSAPASPAEKSSPPPADLPVGVAKPSSLPQSPADLLQQQSDRIAIEEQKLRTSVDEVVRKPHKDPDEAVESLRTM